MCLPFQPLAQQCFQPAVYVQWLDLPDIIEARKGSLAVEQPVYAPGDSVRDSQDQLRNRFAIRPDRQEIIHTGDMQDHAVVSLVRIMMMQ